MSGSDRTYIAIDLKSFYASVECVERGLDPLRTNLVVADPSRTDKTICLAVSPSLKAYGIPGRARLFEVNQKVAQVNRSHPGLHLDFIVAPPQMARYMEVSSQIYAIYLKFVAPEDMHVYSVDEVFIDATDYLQTYKCTARQLTMAMVRQVLKETGITATAGIGTNLYLCKVAMDIEAKHQSADADGVRIAELDEMSYRRALWSHTPLTDFWRVGRGTASRLESVGIHTMGELARRSLDEGWEEYLYKVFGINAELLIDHAWGWEPCTIADIKAYRPSSNSISMGQVLKEPYDYSRTLTIVREMTDLLALDLVEKRLVTDQLSLYIGYDSSNLTDPQKAASYQGRVAEDHYGRMVPRYSSSTINLGRRTSSTRLIQQAMQTLYKRIADPKLSVRRITIGACHIVSETECAAESSLFDQPLDSAKERREQEAIIEIRRRFGKNAILKGINFEDGATTIERNGQIGGHKAYRDDDQKER